MTKKNFTTKDFTPTERVHYLTKNNVWDTGVVTAIGDSFVFVSFLSGFNGPCDPKTLHKFKSNRPRND